MVVHLTAQDPITTQLLYCISIVQYCTPSHHGSMPMSYVTQQNVIPFLDVCWVRHVETGPLLTPLLRASVVRRSTFVTAQKGSLSALKPSTRAWQPICDTFERTKG